MINFNGNSGFFPNGIQGYNYRITTEGGYCIKLKNKTGSPSIKGTVVAADGTEDYAAQTAPSGSNEPIGVVYNSGIEDGKDIWVVVYGIAEVLLEDGTAATRGNWAYTSTVAGRADMTQGDPLGTPPHWREIGHCIETKPSGSDVLAKCILHFN